MLYKTEYNETQQKQTINQIHRKNHAAREPCESALHLELRKATASMRVAMDLRPLRNQKYAREGVPLRSGSLIFRRWFMRRRIEGVGESKRERDRDTETQRHRDTERDGGGARNLQTARTWCPPRRRLHARRSRTRGIVPISRFLFRSRSVYPACDENPIHIEPSEF